MATPTITPASPAAPAAPAAAPSAPAAAAPVAPVAATVAAPAAPAPVTASEEMLPGEHSQAFIQRRMKEKAAAATAPPAAPEKKEEPAAEAVEVPKVEGEEKKEPVVEAPKEPVAPAEPTEDAEDFSLDPLGPLPTKDLAQALEKNPELGAALEKAGIDRNTLFATARLAQRTAKYDELFSGDLDAAKQAHQDASSFGEISEMFVDADTPDKTRGLLGKFMEFSYQLDEEGNPRIDPATKSPMTDGSVGRFMDNVLSLVLDYQGSRAKTEKKEDLLAAIEILKAETGLSRGTGSAEQEEGLSDELKAERKAINAEKESLRQQQLAETNRKSQEFETAVASGIESGLDAEIEKLLSHTDLQGGQKKWVADQIKERATEKLKNSKLFFSKLDALMRRPLGDKTKQARVAHGLNSARPLIPTIAREVLKEQGVALKAKQAARKEKAATQTEASRSDIKTGGQAPAPAMPTSPAEVLEMARKEFVEKNKREPNTGEMFQAVAQTKRRLGIGG